MKTSGAMRFALLHPTLRLTRVETGTGGKTMKKRNLFAEIAEGFDALAEERIF
jgi:hypothetical protein